jgi:protein TonB
VSDPTIQRPRARDGTPVPVADQPNEIETLPTQDDRRRLVDLPVTDIPSGPAVDGPIIVPDDGPPEPFVPVEKNPVIVKSVAPVYPPLALRAGIEGRVFVKIWVDRQGKVRRVEVLKSENDIFNEAAIEAAKQLVFTPAYMNNGPVSVWVSIPISFKLTGSQ